ncbi:MAG: hypothetical protein MR669_03540 [Selenomonadaceae bacterium]|nr:hypothetical protein [Selenomonadaceae bacterium]
MITVGDEMLQTLINMKQ